MARIADLLAGAHPPLRLLAGPLAARALGAVTSLDSLAAMRQAPAGTLVVVPARVAARAVPYELDVAVRHAAQRDLTALVLIGCTGLPITTQRLADRADLPVLGVVEERDVAEVVLAIDRIIRSGAAEALARARSALAAVREAEPSGDLARLLNDAGAALGLHLRLLDPADAGAAARNDPAYPDSVPATARHSAPATARRDDESGVGTARRDGAGGTGDSDGAGGAGFGGEPVWLDGRLIGVVTATRLSEPYEDLAADDEAARLALPAVAAAAARMRAAALAHEIAPGQLRSDLLTELVVADRTQASRLADRARVLGLPVDGRHVAVWVDVEDGIAGSLAEHRRLLDSVVLDVLQRPRTPEGRWNVARIEEALLILCSSTAGGADTTHRMRLAAHDLVTALADRHPGRALRCGIGTPQTALDGLRTSALEARSAAASAAARGTLVEQFDATGIRRVLAEAAASTLSRRVVDELLRPLDALGKDRSLQAVTTLAAYLDVQRSPRLAGKRLNLHFNAVSYRIRKITETLGADLDDHETRFALHLACRLRLTHLSGG
ncbi:helix-turn-helix domain-containing protein [Nonomuraea sp. NPDC050310]|uniref:PucR family transcriptional regulator n=1 Tax=Nonomuraea sp. NPDC050310 TaxID=3154935 RepID=UPI0033E37D28